MDHIAKVFTHERFGSVQVVVIDGKEMFAATQVAAALGYKDAHSAIRQHCREDGSVIHPVIDSLGRTQQMKFISEGNVYRLIARSKLPEADQFERWLFDEVAPSLRKHEAYLTPAKLQEVLRDPDVMIALLQDLKSEREERERLQTENAHQAVVIEEQAERLTYTDEILRSTGTMTVTQIAADYDLSAKALNAILNEERVQRSVGGQWVLYRRYHGMGLTKSQTKSIDTDYGPKAVVSTEWTQAGRLLIHRVLTERGVCAMVDRGRDVPSVRTDLGQSSNVIPLPTKQTQKIVVSLRVDA